jgi:imidazolonepropionase-like amidohydrolase
MKKALIGATLIDGTGKPPLEKAVVIIENNKINAAGKAEDVKLPPDAEIIDVTGKTIIPGLIDCHIHMDLRGLANTYEENLVEDKLRTLRALYDMRATLKRGITTIRNAGSVNHIDFAVKEAINNGWFKGPRIIASGQIISMTAPGNDYFKGMYYEADGVDQVRKAARLQIKAGADFLKVMATGAFMNPGGDPGAVQFSTDEMSAIVEEAQKVGIKVAAHAHANQGIINAIKAGVSTIEHGSFIEDDAIIMMIDKGIYLVPTFVAGYHMLKNGIEKGVPSFIIEKNNRSRETRAKCLRKVFEAGVKVAFGSDAGTNYNYHGNNAMELVLFVEEGFLNPLEAIRCGTLIAAEALGIDDLVGTVESGKLADLVVIEGSLKDSLDPLLTGIKTVYKDGVDLAG